MPIHESAEGLRPVMGTQAHGIVRATPDAIAAQVGRVETLLVRLRAERLALERLIKADPRHH